VVKLAVVGVLALVALAVMGVPTNCHATAETFSKQPAGTSRMAAALPPAYCIRRAMVAVKLTAAGITPVQLLSAVLYGSTSNDVVSAAAGTADASGDASRAHKLSTAVSGSVASVRGRADADADGLASIND
jgi:hypothetical protein